MKTENETEIINLNEHDGSVSLEELNEISVFIQKRLSRYTCGSSIEQNGVNFQFLFNGKPYRMRIEKFEYHWDYWMDNYLRNFKKNPQYHPFPPSIND